MDDLSKKSTEALRVEYRRLYDAEAKLSAQRKAIDHELGQRIKSDRIAEEVMAARATLSPDALRALVGGATASTTADGQAGGVN